MKKLVGFDMEASSNDWKVARIASIQLYHPAEKYSEFIPIEMAGVEIIDPKPILDQISKEYMLVGFNLYYDLLLARKYGVKMTPAFDGFVYFNMTPRATNQAEEKRGLKDLVSELLGIHNVPRFQDICPGLDFTKVNINDDRAVEYARNDPKYAVLLAQYLLQNYPTNKEPHKEEMAALPKFIEMTYQGLRVDGPKMATLEDRLGKELAVVNDRIEKALGFSIRPNSSADLARVFQIKGWEVTTTATGRPSFNEEVLKPYKGNPLIDDIIEARGLIYQKPRVANVILKHIVGDRLHPEYQQTGWTGSARVYTKSPSTNSMSMPAREAVIPDEGCKFVYIDWSGAELMLIAQWAGQEDLVSEYRKGTDVLRYVASKVLERDIDSITKDDRTVMKVVVYAILYGSEGVSVSKALGISESDAYALVQTFWDKFPMIKEKGRDIVTKARSRGYTSTITGFARFLNNMDSPSTKWRKQAERKAFNSSIQGSVACLFKRAVARADEILPSSIRIATGVFDSFLFMVPQHMPIEDVIPYADQLSTFEVDGITIKFRYTVGEGYSWAEAQRKS